jgi:hypothetical protein
VKHEAAARLDRTSVVHCAVRRLPRVNLELPQQPAEGDPCPLVADADPDRTVLVMHAHRDDRAFEPWVGHSGHCEKQLARQETRLLNHAATMGRWHAAGKT